MLDVFFRIHDYLVAHSQTPIRRLLMDEIDWNDRLIAIKGGRGVGKTDFLVARAREIEEEIAARPAEKSHRPQRLKLVPASTIENAAIAFALDGVALSGAVAAAV